MRIVLVALLVVIISLYGRAAHLEVILIDGPILGKTLPSYNKNPKDSLEALVVLKTLLSDLHEQAYIAARIDTLFFSQDSIKAFLFRGDKFQWVSLRKGNIDAYLLDRTGFRERLFRQNPFMYKEYNNLEKEFIKLSENNGYPFASIALDSIELTEKGLAASLNYQKGPEFTFDSIMIIGKSKIKKKYLMRHLRISVGQPYSQQRVNESKRLMLELPYLTQKRPPEIVFAKNKAALTLFIEDKKINQIDGIVGFLPGEGADKKLLITGELNLGLRNLMGTGKNLTVEWRKIKQASQTLDLIYFQPKLLGSSIDARVNFNLFKRDSTFLTINRKITFIQRTGVYSKVNLGVGLRTSRPLNGVVDTSLVKFADYNYYTYGLGYERNTLDNIFYPRKGFFFSLQGYLGNKSIRPNPEFQESYYEGTQLRTVQMNLESIVERYTKLGKGSVLLTRLNMGRIFNQRASLFFNDLYQIGGLRTLRGFNENSFFASAFGVATVEYRFFTDETSYLLLFYDQGYMVNDLVDTKKFDYPLGFGAGVSFTTNAGVFNFIYSLGQSNDQKISLNLSKIHFGITSRF